MFSVDLINNSGSISTTAFYDVLLDRLLKELKEFKDKENQKSSIPKRPKKNKFPPYFSLKQVTEGLKTGELIKGTIKIDQRNCQRAYIANEPDYIVASCTDRNRALDGDVVVLKLKPVNEWFKKQKTAIVVYILKRTNPRIVVGFLEDKVDRYFVVLVPRDRRLPNVRIPRGNVPLEYENILFKADINHWKSTKYAISSIAEPIGIGGDIKIETSAILASNNLNLSYFVNDSAFVVEEILVRSSECINCIFTVGFDLERAISCKECSHGNFEVALYVADVALYLKEGSALDKIVYERAHTICLFDDIYHMLPIDLRQRCSFTTGDDKFAFMVSWEITKDGKVISTNFDRTVIKSHGQIIDDVAIADDNLNRSVNNLIKISSKPNLKCAVENFVALANVAVAKQIMGAVPEQTILYQEDTPNRHMLEKWKDLMFQYDIGLDISSLSALHVSIANVNNWELGFCLKYMATRLIRRGYYYHYVGGTDNKSAYTHFASPFNRYMDIIVQRLLEISLEHCKKRQWKKHYLEEIIEHCNRQSMMKLNVEHEINNLRFAYEIEEERSYDAGVIGIGNNYLDVVIFKTKNGLRIYPKKTTPNVMYLRKVVDKMEDKLSVAFAQTDVLPKEQCMFKMFSIFKVKLFRIEKSVTVKARILRPVDVRNIV